MDQDQLEETLVIIDESLGQLITLPRRGQFGQTSVVSAELIDGAWFADKGIEDDIIERIDNENVVPYRPTILKGCGSFRSRLIRMLYNF